MSDRERMLQMRRLAMLKADRAQAELSGLRAEYTRLQGEISALGKAQAELPMPDGPIVAGAVAARWLAWKRARVVQLRSTLAQSTAILDQARTRTARLRARVAAIEHLAERARIAQIRQARNRATRLGLPEE